MNTASQSINSAAKAGFNVQDQVFNELYQRAYTPANKFIDNALLDLTEMWTAANGNMGKQMLVAQIANQYILPAISGIWPALFYYNLQHMAVSKIAPSWFPTDPFPNVAETKKLPDVQNRNGIPGASETFNIMIGAAQTGNLKHHCNLNDMAECID
jgi:hypothetical protein